MQLSLSHFRSHMRTELALDGRPVALYGPNGAGKTNLVEAVSMLSPGRGLRQAAVEDMARAPEAIGWRVAARIVAPDDAHVVEIRAEAGARRLEIDGKPAAQARLGDVARVLWLTPAMDRLWTEAAGERRRFLDRIAMSLVPRHADAALAYEKAMRERNRLLRDESRDAAWYEALEAQMARAGAEIDANRRAALARLATEAARRAGERFSRRAPDAVEREPGRGGGAGGGAARGPAARHGGGAQPDRAAPRRSRGDLCRQGDAGAAVLDRRAEGAPDQRGAGQRARRGG